MKLKITASALFVCTILLLLRGPCLQTGNTDYAPLPVLMYHHFDDSATAGTIVSGEKFREQMTALKDAGYTTVTLPQLLDFVENGVPLPRKPALITMDDGYTSNLEIAAPILEELDMCATVFVIGINEGEDIYIHSGEPLTPLRFSYEEAADWVEKGVLDLQSHSMDMHQLDSYGSSERNGMLPIAGESGAAYRRAIQEDTLLFRRRRMGRAATELTALAYPFGYYSEELDRLLEEEGMVFTFTTEEHCNTLYIGDYSSLRMLGRYNVTEWISGQELVRLLDQSVL